jgi:uncharacterized membrane protein YbhN (UPF0104 family)
LVERLRDHPIVVTAIAFALMSTAVLAIAAAWGFEAFADAWSDLHFGWLAVTICAELLAIPAYVLAYRAVAHVHGGTTLPVPLAVRLVTAGFGPFALGGGFALDRKALYAIGEDERAATVRVLGLGALEWSLLAPAAWVSAVALLVAGDGRPMKSLLWPWAILVPIGFVVGLSYAASGHHKRFARGSGAGRRSIEFATEGIRILFVLVGSFARYWTAWLGIGLYWILDIGSFYGAVAFVGLHTNLGEIVLAYATGYVLTRRSMPLAGAGTTEVLLTFALHWVGQPVPTSLAAVVVYRLFNFVLLTITALGARARIKPLLDAADEDRTPTHREYLRASSPLTPIRRLIT